MNLIFKSVIVAGFSILVFGMVANIFTAWFKLNNYSIVIAVILSLIFLVITRFIWDKKGIWPSENPVEINNLPLKYWLVFYSAMIFGFGAVLVSADATGLASPWQVLPLSYLLSIMIGSAVIFGAIYYGDKIWKILLAIIIFSFLIHSYLLVYHNGFGGDRFRHLASEERLIQGLEYQPTLLTDHIWFKNLGPIKYPQALTDSAKLSYGTQWSLEVAASKLLQVSVFQINRWLLPVLWSLLVPLLVYILASLLISSRRVALLASGLSGSFYLLQYYGAQGLPASYGVLTFLYAMILYLTWLKTGNKKLLVAALIFSGLTYFNYSLAFILTISFGALILAMNYQRRFSKYLAVAIILLLVILDITWPIKLGFSFSAVIDAWRSANLFFFNGSIDAAIGLPIFLIMLAVILGFALKSVKKNNTTASLISQFFAIIILAYLISWVFFGGDHVLARRLMLFATVFLPFIIASGLEFLPVRPKIAPLIVVILSLLTTYSHYSGPVLEVGVTDRDISKALLIWNDIKYQSNYCVKDDIGVILALEYVSAKGFQETINSQNCLKK